MASNENTEMSDTPRTNNYDWSFHMLFAESQKMERELNVANERISKLNDYVAALETAGDEMSKELSYGYDVDMWNQAKEAKL
jgi:hypothetical protein